MTLKLHIKANTNFFTFLALLISLTAFGQSPIQTTPLDPNNLPFEVKLEGTIKSAVKWTDNAGENIVITTETGIYQSDKFKHENEGSDAELFAYHYILSNDDAQQTWKVYDFISDCPVDVECTFLKNTFQVTDLDKDGIAEIWLMYKTACHGDVSPCDMKIIMYEGPQKFAMRGQNKVKLSDTEFEGGAYKLDQAFNKGPKEFVAFAKKLWNKNIMQTWEE